MLNLCLCKLNWGTELEILQNNEVLIARYSVTLFMVPKKIILQGKGIKKR